MKYLCNHCGRPVKRETELLLEFQMTDEVMEFEGAYRLCETCYSFVGGFFDAFCRMGAPELEAE